ncbi:MAG: hypothetical protein EOO60_10770 [Hymenobacter sp.]|nr:MAG: hypothetical protein EOO60_10770 [Hymenobacter sp.]
MNNEYPPLRFILTADALAQLAEQGLEEKDFIPEVVHAITAMRAQFGMLPAMGDLLRLPSGAYTVIARTFTMQGESDRTEVSLELDAAYDPTDFSFTYH